MGFIKRLLGLEKKEELLPFEKKFEEDTGNQAIIKPERRFIEECCALCKKQIGIERYKEVKEFKMHKRCFKKKQKDVFYGKFWTFIFWIRE